MQYPLSRATWVWWPPPSATQRSKYLFPYSEGAILAKWPEFKPKPARKLFEPSDAELARLLAARMSDSLRIWLLNSMATAGRPEAVLDLTPAARVRDRGLIDLNPEGRRQNKKYRPTVRELACQTKVAQQMGKRRRRERRERRERS